eukprot:4194603-Karenia_brevis.AAC.1
MVKLKGDHVHEFGDLKIYANTDSLHDEHPAISKSVRKLVRTIIEMNGGNGKAIKEHIDTNYAQGIVWWKDLR